MPPSGTGYCCRWVYPTQIFINSQMQTSGWSSSPRSGKNTCQDLDSTSTGAGPWSPPRATSSRTCSSGGSSTRSRPTGTWARANGPACFQRCPTTPAWTMTGRPGRVWVTRNIHWLRWRCWSQGLITPEGCPLELRVWRKMCIWWLLLWDLKLCMDRRIVRFCQKENNWELRWKMGIFGSCLRMLRKIYHSRIKLLNLANKMLHSK